MANNKTARITAFIALVAIFGSVIWTGAMIIYESLTWTAETSQTTQASQEQLNEILKNLSKSWATSSWETSTWINLEVNTWAVIDAKTLVPTTK